MTLYGNSPFFTLLSAIVHFVLFIYTFRTRNSPGAVFLIVMTALFSAQGWLSIGELLADGLDNKLLWRNLQQIPLYYSPIMLLGVIMANMGVSGKILARTILLLSGIMLVYWILLFTDAHHHLIREKVWVEPYWDFERIGMERTTLGYVFFSLIYAITFSCFGLLLLNYRKAIGTQRMQYFLLVFAALMPLVLPPLADFLFGLKVNMAASMLPAAVLIFYALHVYKFLQVRPLAKEKVVEHMSEGILVADEHDRVIDANPAARMIRHWNGKRKLVGAYLEDLFQDIPQLLALCGTREQGKTEVELGNEHFEVRFMPIRVRGHHTGSLLIFRDVTERKNYENELIRRANTDGLTGLYNRLHFLELLDKIKKQCELSGVPVSLLLIDVDHFKKINDQYGHMAGDRVLQHFAALLKQCTRERGVAGRIGGEEFAVVVPGIDGAEAYRIAEEIRLQAFRESSGPAESESGAHVERPAYSISIGIAEPEDENMTLEAWMALADACLYASKQNGRNRTTLAEKKPSA